MKSSNLTYVLFFASTVMASEIIGDPGEFYRKQHKNLVAQYDRDGDGFLDAGEREKMRNTPKTQGKGWGRGKKNEKKRVRRDMPKHWIEKYDKDGDGGLSDKEADKGYWTERGILFKNYDQNKDEKLDKQEAEKLSGDIEDGKFESWDHFVATTTLKDATGKDGKRKSNLSARQREWIKYDADGDGIASKEEIAAIRKSKK